MKYNSVCLQITTKCNFMCRHCYLSCGPFRDEVMTKEVIDSTLQKIGISSNRVWISGGEPTLYPNLVEYIVGECKKIKSQFGYPKEICLQTNGSWAKTPKEAVRLLKYYSDLGITDLDLSGYDHFHYEYHKGISIIELGAIANKLNLFNSVTISGSPKSDLKYLGRGKDLEKPKVFLNNCVLAHGHYNINVYGDILICKWGNTCYLGSIIESDLEEIKKYKFVEVLLNKGVLGLIEEYNNKYSKEIRFDGSEDICEICHHITSEWKRQL